MVVKANNDLPMPLMTPIAKDQGPLLVNLEDDNVLNAGAGTCPICSCETIKLLFVYIYRSFDAADYWHPHHPNKETAVRQGKGVFDSTQSAFSMEQDELHHQ